MASEEAIDHTILFEGYSPFIYKDVAGYDTIGHGHLVLKGEKFKVPLLPQDARILLKKDISIAVNGVNRWVRVKLWQEQFDSLMSWTFNLGVGALQGSTMLKRVNAERHTEVPAEMRKWVNAGKRKNVPGLVRRRGVEASMYETGTKRSQTPK